MSQHMHEAGIYYLSLISEIVATSFFWLHCLNFALRLLSVYVLTYLKQRLPIVCLFVCVYAGRAHVRLGRVS